MVLDLHKFQPHVGFAPDGGGLTIVEQIPGTVMIADVTHVLNAHGYWASYNIPYFESIYNASGFSWKYQESKHASSSSADWTYNHTARAEIFARDAPKVQSLDDLKRLIR